MVILTPAASIGVLALVLGAFLAVASVLFKVEGDERAEKIASLLPGANCGGCSYAGCSQFAKAVLEGESVTLCNSIKKESADKIAEILGKEKVEIIPKKAVILCNKSSDATKGKYIYNGILDCAAAAMLSGGPSACAYGCIGLGSCADVCQNKAIKIVDGLAAVDEELCGGCGACVKACPRGVIELIPKKREIFVKCKNRDKGSEVRKYCSVGCISCKICEKNCPSGAIAVDGVAKTDYEKCTDCGLCAEKCPKGIICAPLKKD